MILGNETGRGINRDQLTLLDDLGCILASIDDRNIQCLPYRDGMAVMIGRLNDNGTSLSHQGNHAVIGVFGNQDAFDGTRQLHARILGQNRGFTRHGTIVDARDTEAVAEDLAYVRNLHGVRRTAHADRRTACDDNEVTVTDEAGIGSNLETGGEQLVCASHLLYLEGDDTPS